MTTYIHHVTKSVEGKEVEICLRYTISDHIGATLTQPEEGGEVEIVDSWVEPEGTPYEPTEEEDAAWCVKIGEEHDHADDSGPALDHAEGLAEDRKLGLI